MVNANSLPSSFKGPQYVKDLMMQPKTWTEGDVVIDVEVNVFYDCVEREELLASAPDPNTRTTDMQKRYEKTRSSSIGTFSSSNTSTISVVSKRRRLLRPKGVFKNMAKLAPKLRSRSKHKEELEPQREEIDISSISYQEAPVYHDHLPEIAEVSVRAGCQEIRSGAVLEVVDAPPRPEELPLRFLRAGKNDPVEGQRRYEQTLAWREELGMDTILQDAHPNFDTIQKNYFTHPHLRGHSNEPVWYEKPPKLNLEALKKVNIGQEQLVRHYAMLTEFLWQYVEPGELSRSITVLDMGGIRVTDFAGEVVEITRKLSRAIGEHYPERAGYIFIVNVPYWFSAIWKVAQHFVDKSTLERIKILRGRKEIRKALLERIPIENIPVEYGGTSVPLGQSREEMVLKEFMKHNNDREAGKGECEGMIGGCHYCTWRPSRRY
jgi:hypothetical protein